MKATNNYYVEREWHDHVRVVRGFVASARHDNEMRRSMAETVHTVRHIVSPNATPSTCDRSSLSGWWADANNPLNYLFIYF